MDKGYAVSRVPAGLRPGMPQHQFWNNGAVIKLCHLFNSKSNPFGCFFLFYSMYIQEIIAFGTRELHLHFLIKKIFLKRKIR
jgi:hypothetical protein